MQSKLQPDVEAGPAAAGSAATGGWLTSKAALYTAIVVLVAASGTAVAIGVSQGIARRGGNVPTAAPASSAPLPGPAASRPPPALPPPTTGAPGPAPNSTMDPGPAPAPLPRPAPIPRPTPAPFTVPNGSIALWWDEFNGDSLDINKWEVETGSLQDSVSAGQIQVYSGSSDNLYVSNGSLHITALQDGSSYTSARIDSKKSGAWFPGMQLPGGATLASLRMEARIRVPAPGQGIWASFWLSPPSSTYGGWPLSGEINVMHGINDKQNISQGVHYGDQYPNNLVSSTSTPLPSGQPYSAAYHVFAVDWDLNTIALSINGGEKLRVVSREVDAENGWFTAASNDPQAPFDIPFSIILNVAVGGDWPGPPNDSTPFPATMLVDYVRVIGKPE